MMSKWEKKLRRKQWQTLVFLLRKLHDVSVKPAVAGLRLKELLHIPLFVFVFVFKKSNRVVGNQLEN